MRKELRSPRSRDLGLVVREGITAGAVAALPSGIPSTVHAFWNGLDLLGSSRAIGSLLAPKGAPEAAVLASAVVAHAAISLGWGVVLSFVLPRRATALWGTAAGLAIAGLDLGIVGRLFPEVRRLPLVPQVADHLAYGAVAGAALARLRTAEED